MEFTNSTKVIDCFCFLNELDLLELRLNELKNVVDTFVIVEANKTGSGIYKEFILEKYITNRFKDFNILYVKKALDEVNISNHHLMYSQREEFLVAIKSLNLSSQDIIIMSDLDEIPRESIIKKIKEEGLNHKFTTLELRGFFWWFNCAFTYPENHVTFTCPVLSRYEDFITKTMYEMRSEKDSYPRIPNGGWHFSHCGNLKQIQEKMLASSHVEYSSDTYTSIENINRRRSNFIDPYDRGFTFTVIEVNDYYPKYLLDNRNKYKEYVYGEA